MLFFNYLIIMIFCFSSLFVAFVAILSPTLVSVFAASILSLFMTIMYIVLVAPDVAITEATVGSAISTIFFLLTIKAINKNKVLDHKDISKVARLQISLHQATIFKSPIFSLLLIGAILIGVADAFMEVGVLDNENVQKSYDFYINQSYHDTGVSNIVTTILASYRGFDTMIENLVIMIATIGVLFILTIKDENLADQNNEDIGLKYDKK